ncbi:colibactin biosynthesis aminomalonyl-acyl carrier protein ClbE [uncultured Gilliamella sp.]|uniref:colibactin biosynthesis aminomalonyl-acyl carrier protein ClbE n=1 Tax=uncultured Gilliamella sp. TaxID=1193505 RepID=UPI0025E984FE|nr:colibactin biosynthesis aminomalonyl-acyl carrier protein ClbE [uncultured Gilliamella sp.]
MDTLEMKTAVRQFLARSLRGHTLDDDDNIFSLGLVHSLFTVQIILFIEKVFHVELEVSELQIEQIATVNKIVELVQQETK